MSSQEVILKVKGNLWFGGDTLSLLLALNVSLFLSPRPPTPLQTVYILWSCTQQLLRVLWSLGYLVPKAAHFYPASHTSNKISLCLAVAASIGKKNRKSSWKYALGSSSSSEIFCGFPIFGRLMGGWGAVQIILWGVFHMGAEDITKSVGTGKDKAPGKKGRQWKHIWLSHLGK